MWFNDEELYPRFTRSLLWMSPLQAFFIYSFILFFKIISWNPVLCFIEWLFCLFHWKTIFYLCILSSTLIGFGVLSTRFCSVKKHINSTRFERLCGAISPYCLQHVLATMTLGGMSSFCLIHLLYNFRGSNSFIDVCLTLSDNFEQSFVIGHGCFVGFMFSLKYFICNLYLIKFSLDQESKITYVKRQIYSILKESFFCVLKAVHWYYIGVFLFGSPLKFLTFQYFYSRNRENDFAVYRLLNPKLFLVTMCTGVMIFFIWSLYLTVFNAFAAEHHKFPIKAPLKGHKTRTLTSALACKESDYVKYLAVLDFRLLAQYDPRRREQIFAISDPGGHPHEWKAISRICITALQDFLCQLYNYSASAASSESKVFFSKVPKTVSEKNKNTTFSENQVPDLFQQMFFYFRKKPLLAYFLDELPNAKLMKIFASSQPYIWMIDALGYLISVSYAEDKYGVVQQTLPDIISLFLDIKMAEEKMPIGLVGIRAFVKDPQGRYEHIHQRLLLKTTLDNVLFKISNTFKNDISGISLSEEYKKYLQRYLGQKN